MNEQNQKDLDILEALYLGNHLSQDEKERALKLLYLLNRELKQRVENEQRPFH